MSQVTHQNYIYAIVIETTISVLNPTNIAIHAQIKELCLNFEL